MYRYKFFKGILKMENMTFDDAIAKLEGILDRLENEHNLSFEEQQKLYQEAEELKNHCRALLDKEKEEIFRIAKENNILIIHDNAYSDIIYDGREGKSFLSFPGAKEVGVEFYSLSKSYNYTGARMSFVIGNAEVIEVFKRFRSQIDYGIFLPIQAGASLDNGTYRYGGQRMLP